MAKPSDISVIDLMMSVPGESNSGWYDFIKPMLMDNESREMFKMPAQYMFKDIPDTGKQEDYLRYTIEQMDKHNIQASMVGVDVGYRDDSAPDEGLNAHKDAVKRHPERFIPCYEANPNKGMDEVRKIRDLHREWKIKAVTAFPSGLCPQVALNDAKWYPIYATCIDLDIPFCPCVGVPGPRVPMYPQKVEHLDEVCWFFPELRVVMRHGAEPWQFMAVKLMLKYPNLHYMTSAFAPRHYPEEIVHFANTRGSDKILYAGYFPMGMSLDRIFSDMAEVPFRDHVWPKFLRENAIRVFKLDHLA